MALNNTFIPLQHSILPIRGSLALSERPKIKEIKQLQNNCVHMVTILAARGEQAHLLGREAERQGMDWHWLKITKITDLTVSERHDFKQQIHTTLQALAEDANVVIHCSAGLHRTGVFAYVLLITMGLDATEALQIIRQSKPETAEAFTSKYIQIAESLL